MNSIELEVEMKRHGDTGDTLAQFLNMTPQTFSAKKNGIKSEFTQKEISSIKERYELDSERIVEIFFN